MKNYREKLQIGRMRPQRGEMVRRLQTRACHFGTVSRLRARAALWPLWGPILASWPKWRQTGALEPLSLEDDSQFQIGTLSFEDDSQFRPQRRKKKLKMVWKVLQNGLSPARWARPVRPQPAPRMRNGSQPLPLYT